jgi:putative phage-type endonuclease
MNITVPILKDDPTRYAWLEERRSYLGATDIAAILGYHPYRTPLEVWRSKMGMTLPEGDSTGPAARGINLEWYVADIYKAVTGRKLRKSRIAKHPSVPYFVANPDYDVVGERGLVECKTCNEHLFRRYFGVEGTDEMPTWYLLQCQWQLFLTGREWCDLAVLGGLDTYRIYTTHRDQTLIGQMANTASVWWQTYVEGEVAPPATGNDTDSHILLALHPKDDGSQVTASEQIAADAELLHTLILQMRDIEYRVEELRNRMKEAIGDASTLLLPNGESITWKSFGQQRTNWKAVAQSLKPSKKRLAQFTVAQTVRQLRVPASWGKDED